MAIKEIHDKNIWQRYLEGFKDAGKRKSEKDLKEHSLYYGGTNDKSDKFTGIEKIAYQQGWSDFVVGDDISSVDERSKKETIQMIWDKFLKNIPL